VPNPVRPRMRSNSASSGSSAAGQVAALAATGAALDDPYGVAILLDTLREAGAEEQVTELLARNPAAVDLDNQYRVARLLNLLRAPGVASRTMSGICLLGFLAYGMPRSTASEADQFHRISVAGRCLITRPGAEGLAS
jgi:hypothetical protein